MKSNILTNMSDIFLYNHWANERLIHNVNQVRPEDYIKTFSIPFKNLHGLLHHLYYYEAKYYSELTGDTIQLVKKSDELSKEQLFENILAYSQSWNRWLHDATVLENIEIYFQTIFDLSVHNNYHRGQINTLISILGYKPQSLDIFLYRTSLTTLS